MAETEYRRLACKGCSAGFETECHKGHATPHFCRPCFGKNRARDQAAQRVKQAARHADGIGQRCSIPGCQRFVKCKGICLNHYVEQRKQAPKSSCVVVGCDRDAHSKGMCIRHYSRQRRFGTVEDQLTLNCAQCSAEFQSPRKILYCSGSCKYRTGYEKSRRENAEKPKLRHRKTCAQCGTCFEHAWRSVVMYCGKACKQIASKIRTGRLDPQEMAIREAARTATLERKAASTIVRDAVRSTRAAAIKAEKAALAARRPIACGICAKTFRAGVNGNAKYCSAACRAKSPAAIAAKNTEKAKADRRARRQARKALLRSTDALIFDPIAILERDGWCCQICGVKTPKKLRGTFKPNAPEVDHIVPVAKGGPTIPENLQCACRRCNAKKTDGPAAGQIGLFTSLLNEAIPTRRRTPRIKPPEPAHVAGFAFLESPHGPKHSR